MKLIKDDGTVLGEFNDEAAVVIYDPEGVSVYTPDADDQDRAPIHVVMACSAAGYSMTEEGAQQLVDWFESQLKQAREEP